MKTVLSFRIVRKEYFYSYTVILLLLFSNLFLYINLSDDLTYARTVSNSSQKFGYWNDTFVDTTKIHLKNNVTVDLGNESVKLELDGYFNNFDFESMGYIKNWTYETSSNTMSHSVVGDPFFNGKCLFLARNDNLASYAEHRLWLEFDSEIYNLVRFDLTPFSIEGTQRQGYFYIEFYDNTNVVIHEVRYYWDDLRNSGVPANTSALTAVDLGWVLPTGAPNTIGDKKFYLFENISENLDANAFADSSSIFQNTKTARYGFYQDAGGGWLQVDQVYIDNLTICNSKKTGDITSAAISPVALSEWQELKIVKTENLPDQFITTTILNSTTNQPINGFTDLTGSTIDISSLDVTTYPSIRLRASFYGDGFCPELHEWGLSWKINNVPVVSYLNCSINATKTLLRTNSAIVSATGYDVETAFDELSPNFQYKYFTETDWETDHLSGLEYNSNQWQITFTPPADAYIGFYDLRVRFLDEYGGICDWFIEYYAIDVLNNKPGPPEIQLLPAGPKTIDDLTVYVVTGSDDVEDEPISYTYLWYLNGELQESLVQNFSTSLKDTVSRNNTIKNEVWKCVVIPHDGNDFGTQGSTEVTVLNSAPDVIKKFVDVTIPEDGNKTLENKLSYIFRDADQDNLTYFSEGWENIDCTIDQVTGTITLTPPGNWGGTEYIEFHANDSIASSPKETLKVIVTPVNDLPRIAQVGEQVTTIDNKILEFTVYQDDWLNLSVSVEDIDGDLETDKITYHTNITGYDNMMFDPVEKELSFHPGNSDVGWHYVNISISDNNETPVVFVTQHIRIKVLNVNDPPSVEIFTPFNGDEFSEGDPITFGCTANDIDFLIPAPTEKLTYRWYTRAAVVIELGTNKDLPYVLLEPGEYNITVEVIDSSNATATDHLNIKINKKDTTIKETANNLLLWLTIVIILIIIIVILLFFVLRSRRRRSDEDEGPGDEAEVQQPSLPGQSPGQPLAEGQEQMSLPPAPVTQQPGIMPQQPSIPTKIYSMPQPKIIVQEKVEVKEAEVTQENDE